MYRPLNQTLQKCLISVFCDTQSALCLFDNKTLNPCLSFTTSVTVKKLLKIICMTSSDCVIMPLSVRQSIYYVKSPLNYESSEPSLDKGDSCSTQFQSETKFVVIFVVYVSSLQPHFYISELFYPWLFYRLSYTTI